jgi:hypothetical protein
MSNIHRQYCKKLIGQSTRYFSLSAPAILAFTGIAKLWSSFGSTHILQIRDSILGLSFGHLMFVAGVLELTVAGVCLFGKAQVFAVALVAWLATSFLVYRLGLVWVGYHKPCNCLGNLTDALHIPPQTADTAMKIVLGYLLVGSYATLF